jgi:glycerate 2-kinase
MGPERFLTETLRNSPRGKDICEILAAAINAVDPFTCVRRFVKWDGDGRLQVAGRAYDLSACKRIFIIAIGKASLAMAMSLSEILKDRLDRGIIVAKHIAEGEAGHIAGFELVQGGHPVPNEASLVAGRKVAGLLSELQAEDLVFCLISGGGSALMTLPVEGVTLEEVQQLTHDLLACGATIQEINTLRKHLDRLKGGGMARLAHPAHLTTLILSDVVGSPLDVIASGPTVGDSSTFEEAADILEKYDLPGKMPAAILDVIEKGRRGDIPDTLKPGDACFTHVHNVLVGANHLATKAALERAKELGFNTLLLTTYLQGEASQAGKVLASIARQVRESGEPLAAPACLVAGGETTVTIRGKGRGGRNQELALGAVAELAGLSDAFLITLATDGEDGPTDAAGAVVSGDTYQRAARKGVNPAGFLAQNNAYPFFEALGDLLITGSTGTNVNDLNFIFVL